MSWLEDALARSWTQVRSQDLACFAFNAVKPDWPRRYIALSHRSMDAKPILQTMKAWISSLFAIDANYAPSWETNTGMVWGLFAATPVLIRIQSPNYAASEWCEREAELIRYLEETCDFMPRRWVFDLSVEEALANLDRVVDTWRPLSDKFSVVDRPEAPALEPGLRSRCRTGMDAHNASRGGLTSFVSCHLWRRPNCQSNLRASLLQRQPRARSTSNKQPGGVGRLSTDLL